MGLRTIRIPPVISRTPPRAWVELQGYAPEESDNPIGEMSLITISHLPARPAPEAP